MRTFARHLALCALPVVGGIGTGLGFAVTQASCASLVGVLLAASCHTRQLEYQLRFHLLGAIAGALLAAGLGAWLERRRQRAATTEIV